MRAPKPKCLSAASSLNFEGDQAADRRRIDSEPVVIFMANIADDIEPEKGIFSAQDHIAIVVAEIELDKVYNTERRLFYVACTSSRKELIIFGVLPADKLFTDFRGGL